jgi:hypothetical protein
MLCGAGTRNLVSPFPREPHHEIENATPGHLFHFGENAKSGQSGRKGTMLDLTYASNCMCRTDGLGKGPWLAKRSTFSAFTQPIPSMRPSASTHGGQHGEPIEYLPSLHPADCMPNLRSGKHLSAGFNFGASAADAE